MSFNDVQFDGNDESNDSNVDQDSKDESDSSHDEIVNHNKREVETEPELSNKKLKTEKSKNKNLYKQPTADEISRLRETEQLFNSNLFRLQIEQLLDEIKVKEKYKKIFYTWFENIKSLFENLPEHEVKLTDLSKKQKGITCIIKSCTNHAKTDQDVNIKLKNPDKCVLFGINKFNAVTGSKFKMNISVQIPEDCLLAGDYLNNRLKIKQTYYASYIYVNLTKSKLCSQATLRKSVIEIVPSSSDKILVYLHVVPPENYFKLSRLEPNKNNVRENFFNTCYEFDTALLKSLGTPYYNSALLHDLTLKHNYYFAESALKDLNNVHDGVKLLTVWLQQRGLYDNQYGFSDVLLTQTILYLTIKRKVNRHMSSYQVVRNFWVFLATTNWHENPISICENVKSDLLEMFKENFDVVFVDKSGSYNLAAFLYYDVYMKLRSESQLAITFVDDVTFDLFGGLFMNHMNPEIQYDALLVLKDSGCFKIVFDMASESEKCKHVGFYQRLIIKTILSVLRKGLNRRIAHILPIASEDSDNGSFTQITFGITLDPNHAFSLIEKGPEANTPEAFEFKKFWGKLSECRRFVDGAICEAVYFPAKSLGEKRRIFQTVINFIVKKKLKIEKHYIIADQFENVITLKNPAPLGTGEEACVNVITAFDEISKQLREAKLPLVISAVQGASQAFCYTATYPPTPCDTTSKKGITTTSYNNIVFKEPFKFDKITNYVEPVECVIQLGINSKWPQDLQALRYIQLGFYIELSKYLEIKAIPSNVRRDCLDVFYKGLIFRFRLHNPREITELRKYTQPDGTIAYQDTKESLNLECNLNVLPRIIGALHGIQSENPTFGASSTLIKRWLRSQLIDEFHIPDIVIDLLNASLYINSAPYNAANLPQVSFLRFLKFVAHCDWSLQPIIVNFNNELTKESIDDFETSFQQVRHNYPPLAIITPYDNRKSYFSRNCNLEILKRCSVLAMSTYAIVKSGISTINLTVIKDLYVPNMHGYNIIIHLQPFLNPRRYQNAPIDNDKKDTQHLKIPVVNFSPIEIYLNELRQNYGEFALFFYNSYGGNVIGVLWKPNVLDTKPFKIAHVDGKKIEKKNLVLNIDAIVEDFRILGDGLVKTIERLCI